MTTATNILKLRNTKGEVLTCSHCGREIKHAFQVGTRIYGSDCVISLFGAAAEKKVKDQLFLAKAWDKISDETKSRSMAIYGSTEEQAFNRFITTGNI